MSSTSTTSSTASTTSSSTSTTTTIPLPYVQDEFNDESLGEWWTESYQSNGGGDESGIGINGRLTLTTGADKIDGNSFDASGVYQDDITGDFDIKIKMTAVTGWTQFASRYVGIAVYIDEDHYYFGGSNTGFEYQAGGGSASGGNWWRPDIPQWYRAKRVGSNVTIYHSDNGTSWSDFAGTQAVGSGACRVWITANDNSGGGDATVDIDYFIATNRPEPEYTTSSTTSTSTSTSTSSSTSSSTTTTVPGWTTHSTTSSSSTTTSSSTTSSTLSTTSSTSSTASTLSTMSTTSSTSSTASTHSTTSTSTSTSTSSSTASTTSSTSSTASTLSTVSTHSTTSSSSSTTTTIPFAEEDHFDNNYIEDFWTESLQSGGSASEPPGTVLELTSGNAELSISSYNPSWIYQSADEQSFDVYIRVLDYGTASRTDELYGILCEFNATHYMYVGYTGSSQQVRYGYKQSGSSGSGQGNENDIEYLRMKRVGDTVTVYASTNGTSWIEINDRTFSGISSFKCGIFANHWGSGSQFTIDVDYFWNTGQQFTTSSTSTSTTTSTSTSSSTLSTLSTSSTSSSSTTTVPGWTTHSTTSSSSTSSSTLSTLSTTSSTASTVSTLSTLSTTSSSSSTSSTLSTLSTVSTTSSSTSTTTTHPPYGIQVFNNLGQKTMDITEELSRAIWTRTVLADTSGSDLNITVLENYVRDDLNNDSLTIVALPLDQGIKVPHRVSSILSRSGSTGNYTYNLSVWWSPSEYHWDAIDLYSSDTKIIIFVSK